MLVTFYVSTPTKNIIALCVRNQLLGPTPKRFASQARFSQAKPAAQWRTSLGHPAEAYPERGQSIREPEVNHNLSATISVILLTPSFMWVIDSGLKLYMQVSNVPGKIT